ncbi:Thiosulfate sulfurtransferase/rhodanese-like domain-containing protein 3 [Kickxella alabastrina]|uniref:Thiosulfate sulfurtransferase/rhodanese-like domain-containing protein 3 n=1 Tax=Kickxella alabastrina TaxID=61397 RepID=A0ACC1IPA5_9FUNG|nr:Thiosulfate sulfurtransferase/rhodanese-like domain-containing protein 3 [Kickxella alabastrina]
MSSSVPELVFDEIKSVSDGNPFNGRELTIIDVRNPGEFEGGHIPNAHNVPLPELNGALKLSPEDFTAKYNFVLPSPEAQDKGVVVHCQVGGRAAKAADIFAAKDYKENLYIYRPGWSEYSNKETASDD